MSDPIRQHWVPQFYLRYFATPESKGKGREQVWAVARDKKAPLEPLRSSIKGVAVEKLLYSPQMPDGSRDFALEKRLCDLEGLLTTIWPHVAGPQIQLSKEMPRILALFLATMYLRHPAQRQSVVDAHRRVVQQVEAHLKSLDKIPSHLTYSIKGKKWTVPVDEFEAYKNASANDHHRSFVEYVERTAMPLAKRLLKKRWTFVVSDEPVFVTCDNPMSLRGPDFTDAKIGFGTPGMTVEFPISPHVLLHLDDGKGIQVSPLTTSPFLPVQPWAAFNCEMWTNASRFMFSHRDPYGVLEEIAGFYEYAKTTYEPEA